MLRARLPSTAPAAASASALTTLSGTVTALSTTVGTKADTSTVTALSNTVNTDVFRLGTSANTMAGSGGTTNFYMTNSSNDALDMTYLQLQKGSSNGKEMGMRIFGATQALRFTGEMNLEDLAGGAETTIGSIKTAGIDLASGKTYAINGTALTAGDLGVGGSLTLDTLSVSNGGGGATAGMVIADGKITANDGIDIPTGHLSCTNGLKLQDGIQMYQAHVDASASQPRLWSGISRLQAIMAANQIDASKVMKCNFASLPMNAGYAANDYITGTGHTNTPQTKKYSNHYQTVFEGTVGTDLTLFSKSQTSVSGAPYSVDLAITPSDYSPAGTSLDHVIINGTGYINWAHTSFPTSVSRKNNKLIRVGHYVNDGVRITIDGQPIVFTKWTTSMSIQGTGNDNFNSVFVARGDWSALEIIYIAGGGGNFMTLQFNVLAAWD